MSIHVFLACLNGHTPESHSHRVCVKLNQIREDITRSIDRGAKYRAWCKPP